MKYSVVIPVYNEAANIKYLYERLSKTFVKEKKEIEFIFINDGSNDDTLDKLIQLNRQDFRVKIINFSRNFGHQMAVSAGLKFCRGEMIGIIDADLQDPPELLPKFFQKLKEGYDVVYAIRKKRKDSLLMKLAYASYYRLLKMMAEIDIPLDSGDFCALKRRVVKAINSLPERNRFIRGIRSWVGFKQIGLEYERDERYAGKSKYNLKKLLKLAFDGVFSFSYLPFKFMFYLGFFALIFSFFGGIFIFYMKFFTANYNKVPGFATTITLLIFFGGLQLFTLGITGEYIKRIYDEVKQRPPYIIESKIGF